MTETEKLIRRCLGQIGANAVAIDLLRQQLEGISAVADRILYLLQQQRDAEAEDLADDSWWRKGGNPPI